MLQIKKEAFGVYRANCYVLIKEGKAVIIDPGFSPEKIERMLCKADPVAILLTHGHIDHIGAVKALHQKYNIPIYMSKKEDALLHVDTAAPEGYHRNFGETYYDLPEGNFHIDNFSFEIISTPGHTVGSVLIRYENHVFTGDTLFKGTIGRTDVFSSSPEQMKESIAKIKTLNPDYIIYPGHSENSTLREEFEYNPFYRRLF